jgi:hypothetical protein
MSDAPTPNNAERLALVVARIGSGVGMTRAELERASQRLDDVQRTLDQLHGILANKPANP